MDDPFRGLCFGSRKLTSDQAKVSGKALQGIFDDISIAGGQDWIHLWDYFSQHK